ncbi:RNA-binding domain-containing protein [Rickenella mellea]|uniref:RNA-binding domain-containing protein n=1 Tax=Rickenella mellea TaxID=50990 RepID=A0A4Y7Q7B5_9AGAM|nr:RNA-binding domain-containing protein [Rickenella mellea]
MDTPKDHSPRPSSSAPSSTQSPIPQPPAVLSNEDIEAVIKMATSTRPNAEGRPLPNRDTRTQLFIGNLPYRVRWQDLKDLFRKAGTVLRADVSLGPDNRSRGYGTVLLATAEDAGRAVDMFNGYSWQTRTLEVRLDRLPPELDYSTASNLNVVGMPSSSSMPTMPVMRNLGGVSGGLNNLPFHCQWQDLKDLFRQAGTVVRADVALGSDGRSRGFGTVMFATEADAERAVKNFNGCLSLPCCRQQ